MTDAVNSQGAAPSDLNAGSAGAAGNPAPVIVNTPPDPAAGKPQEVDQVDAKAKADADAAAAAAAKANDAKVDDAADAIAEFEGTGHQAADAALAMLKEGGLQPADMQFIFGKARQTNNLADVNVAAIEAKLGKTKAALVMAGVTAYYNDNKAKSEAVVNLAHQVAGGKEAWTAVSAWINNRAKSDKAFAAEVAETRKTLDAGGKNAKLALADLVAQYNADPNTKGLNNSLLKGDGAAAGQAPLGRAEYVQLCKQHQGNPAMLAQLNARRAAGRQQGMR